MAAPTGYTDCERGIGDEESEGERDGKIANMAAGGMWNMNVVCVVACVIQREPIKPPPGGETLEDATPGEGGRCDENALRGGTVDRRGDAAMRELE